MHEHSTSPGAAALIPWLALACAAGLYLQAAAWERRRGAGWDRGRSLAFAAGILLLGAAWAPSLTSQAHQDLRAHMVQHLLVGMLAPIGLACGAPLTLALRALPAPLSRRVAQFFNNGLLHMLAYPFSALVLNIGGMYLLYLTPLFALSLSAPLLHGLIQAHFLLAGLLFTWTVLAPPGLPCQAPARTRLAALLCSAGAHAVLAKMMYAYALPRTAFQDLVQTRQAAQIMYYGGDLAEILLAVLFFSLWYRGRRSRAPASGPRLPHTARPMAVSGSTGPTESP